MRDIEADEHLLTVALTTLLENALRFTRVGGTVTVRARLEKRQALFEVEDECGGLSPRRLDELLTPFAQAAKDRAGVGLGLAATRDAVEAHGGELAIHNKPGAGCVFSVALPHDRVAVRLMLMKGRG